MPYTMKYFYHGLDKTDDYVKVKVYWFSLVDQYGSHALCYTIEDPHGDVPNGLTKDMWLTTSNRFLKPE